MTSEEIPEPEMGETAGADERTAGTNGRVLDLTDPKAMRAVAHPVRMALLELMSVASTLTATQASEALGESPANCAFHLRTLAKYGYVTEAGGGKGRERPWKLAHTSINLNTHHENAATTMTARAVSELWLDRTLRRARQILTSTDEFPEGWRDAEQASQTFAFLTADEMREVCKRVRDELRCYQERREDPSLRPPGALPVELLFFGYPVTDLAQLAAVTSSSGETPFTGEAPSSGEADDQ